MPRLSVSPGQQFTTPEANALLRMQREWQGSRRRGVGNPILHQADSQTIAWCYNATGYNLLHGQIVGIDFDTNPIDPAYDGWHEVMLVRGETPTTATHSGSFGVCLEPIPSGEYGPVVIGGACRCRLSVTSASDTYAEVTNNSVSYLTTSTTGTAKILYKQTGTGEKWGIVRLGHGAATTPTIYTATTSSLSVTISTEEQHDITSLTSSSNFSLASGIITADADGVCDFWFSVNSVAVPFTRNNHTDLYFTLQTRTTSGDAWGTAMVTLRRQTSWPDVAVLSGGGVNNEYNEHGAASRSFVAGRQFRIVSELESGTLPAGTGASQGKIVIVKR